MAERVSLLSDAEFGDSMTTPSPALINGGNSRVSLLSHHGKPRVATAGAAQQFRALITKKFHVCRRDPKFVFLAFVWPIGGVIMLLIITHLAKSNLNTLNEGGPLRRSVLPGWGLPGVLPYVTGASVDNATAEALFADWPDPRPKAFMPYSSMKQINALANDSSTSPNSPGAIQFHSLDYSGSIDVSVYFNSSDNTRFSTTCGFLVALGTAVLRKITGNPNATFVETSRYLPDKLSDDIDVWMFYGPLLVSQSFSYVAAMFGIALMQEKEDKTKFQLLLNGSSRLMYWAHHFVGDFIICWIPQMIAVALFFIFKVKAFSENSFLASFLIFTVFSAASVGEGYFLSLFFQKAETANRYLYPLLSILLFVPEVLVSAVWQGSPPQWANVLLSLFPPFGLYNAVSEMENAQFNHHPLTLSTMFVFKNKYIVNVIMMTVGSSLLLLITLVWDFEIIQKVGRYFTPVSLDDLEQATFASDERMDRDVREEKKRAAELIHSPDHPLVVHNLKKVFYMGALGSGQKARTKYAVRGVSLAVNNGESFGLLGPNGAGKTTLLSMLIGYISADAGEARLRGQSVSAEPRKGFLNSFFSFIFSSGVRLNIGVCPQHDALFATLTAEEHLYLYGRLKGMSAEELKSEIPELLSSLDLDHQKKKKSSEMSGGNRRKLSVAISLVGNPAVLFLDEPSSSMDPGTRRKLWTTLLRMREGRAIILTTHSMEEADALCGRIGILVSGQLRCIGPSQHLKNIYGAGYRLTLKVPAERADDAMREVLRVWGPRAQLISEIAGTLQYQLSIENADLAAAFSSLQALREPLQIQDQALTQTTLEQVFLRFAMQQTVEEEADERSNSLPPPPGCFAQLFRSA